ncbi:GGDEF domain-containing protein [Bosea sp. (in: a-proteobacteria)]|uniref:GGDEF domain-containing protein n=1 Tax=Bosea sp. (in: a-proteobacteria) TaxID=1871050 RepID=UPI0026244F90|nr:GGDEF domain-containing protein [Bosea sp. (in: a-proteobacteria)]MCO5093246.1 GGDEF domain-containing protein [Bosea sp. (in: a-proteobacteria)]
MILDLRTIFVTGALTCFIIGAMQLMTFATGRFTRNPVWWGVSSLCIGTGLLGTALRGAIPDIASIEFANTALLAGCLLLLFGIRNFAGRRLDWFGFGVVLLGTWTLLSLSPGPEGYATRVMVVSTVMALCDAAIVREALRLGRQEGLRSAWLLAILFAPTVVVYAGRIALAALDQVGTTLFPAESGATGWLAASGVAFIILRGQALLLLSAERSNRMLATLARRDPLTGAMNRSGLEQWLAQQTHGEQRAALLLVDIDHFKRLNDTLGHAAGDRILRVFAAAVRDELRSTDILARQGGDEFAIILPDIGVREAVRVAERIRHAFRDKLADLAEARLRPTLSIGVAEAGLGGRELDDLLVEADEALYRAKRLGRDRVQAQLSSAA